MVVFVCDRLARAIRASHHQNIGSSGRKEKMMKRRVREHHTEFIVIGRDFGKLSFRGREYDWPSGRGQQRFSARGEFDEIACCCEIFDHHGEWLFFSEFSFAQIRNSVSVFRVTREVVTAETFHGHDAAQAKNLSGLTNACVACDEYFRTHFQGIRRAAIGTRDRLRMEAAVGGIAVFGRAERVERPGLHRCVRTIVGKLLDDGVAWAAVRAVDIRIVIAPICWIKEFLDTCVANREIR